MSMPDQPQRGLLPALGWACYLGSSWTWVIGMFFPILLLRDYGVWGWVVFAVPNVVGAAAMGFVLTRESSRQIVREHRAAVAMFSAVTGVFHYFVFLGIGFAVFFSNGGALPFVGTFFGLLLLLAWRVRLELAVASIVTVVSLILFCAWHFLGDSWAHMTWSLDRPRLGVGELLYFVPASVAGFTLCPYLDVTFHRTRQETGTATGRLAFALGFGGIFLCMILFSLSYAGALEWLFSPLATTLRMRIPSVLLALLAVHIVLQAGFTATAHATAYSHATYNGVWRPWRLLGGSLIFSAIACLPSLTHYLPVRGMTPLEVSYRSYLLCYGLVFPAYVWLCMIPSPWKHRHVSPRRKRLVFVVATVIALPMAFAGFVLGVSWWIPMSLGVLVLARGVLEMMAKPGITPGVSEA